MIRCAVTGTSGYLGSRLAMYLEKQGVEVVRMTHSLKKVGGRAIEFSLGDEVMVESLRGLEALIHCAYDFTATGWTEIVRKNVDGTRRLLVAARTAGIKTVIFVSSMSSFSGCLSLYGRAKLLGERAATESGAFVVRPGLVYDSEAGGMIGALRSVIQRISWVPVLKTRDQRLYLLHSDDFCRFVSLAVTGKIGLPKTPVTLANSQGVSLDEIVRVLGKAMGKKLMLIPVPSGLVYAVLRAVEFIGIRTRLRSDAVQSMMCCDPAPSFAEMNALKFSPVGFSANSFERG